MIMIRSAEDFARLLSKPPDPELRSLLQIQAERLAEYGEYDLFDLAMFAIVQPDDSLDTISAEIGWPILDDEGPFSRPAELIDRYEGWFETTTILSDDGFGLVLYVPINRRTNHELIQACEVTWALSQALSSP